MTGTSPQAPGFINCTASGMRGAALTGLLPILAPNIRWNEGVMRAVTIHRAGGHSLQRHMAGAGLLRDDLGGVDRSECRRRSSLTHGRMLRRIRREGPGRHQGPHDGDDPRRARIATAARSERSCSIQPPAVAAPTPITMGSTARAIIACHALRSRMSKRTKRTDRSCISIAGSSQIPADQAGCEAESALLWQ